ncbi:hypothetical protein PG2001B_1112 [Bifidobacterium pseudolongum subsp. globosum]|uniref:Uncharacterized protein n=2 Tax=Bifidobacterium pseudolongum TaxID=1694 RepID=A0A4Q5AWR1_9BIFI|nr:hypothetical protein PG2001B_1112 [Bifidobacterium pseudolongum subsp. globosum]
MSTMGPMSTRDAQCWRQTGWVLYRILTDLGYLKHSSEDKLSNEDLDRLRCDLRNAHAERILDRVCDEIDSVAHNAQTCFDRLRSEGRLTRDLETRLNEDIHNARLIRKCVLQHLCTCEQPHGTSSEEA